MDWLVASQVLVGDLICALGVFLVVETCIAAGLVGGEGFAVDASLIAADANKQRFDPRQGLGQEARC